MFEDEYFNSHNQEAPFKGAVVIGPKNFIYTSQHNDTIADFIRNGGSFQNLQKVIQSPHYSLINKLKRENQKFLSNQKLHYDVFHHRRKQFLQWIRRRLGSHPWTGYPEPLVAAGPEIIVIDSDDADIDHLLMEFQAKEEPKTESKELVAKKTNSIPGMSSCFSSITNWIVLTCSKGGNISPATITQIEHSKTKDESILTVSFVYPENASGRLQIVVPVLLHYCSFVGHEVSLSGRHGFNWCKLLDQKFQSFGFETGTDDLVKLQFTMDPIVLNFQFQLSSLETFCQYLRGTVSFVPKK